MLEQAITRSNLSLNIEKAQKALESARGAHEKYLIRLNEEDLHLAIEHYITAIKLDPALPEAYYRLASLMWENGQIGLQSAIEQCKTAITISPKNVNAHIYTGYFLKLAGDFDAAHIEFDKAIKLAGMNSARPRLIMSLSLLQQMNIDKATIRNFAKCLYYFITGSIAFAWDFASLKMLYKNFLEDFSIFTYKTTGEAFEKFKQYPIAAKIYAGGIKKTGKDELFYNKLADMSVRINQMEIASDCYKKALKANPKNRDILIKLAILTQKEFPENVDEAIDCYNKLLEIEKNPAPIYYELGHLYLNKKDKIHAISAFKLALECDPDNPFFNNSLAYAFTQAELYDEAIDYYQKAIKLNPDKEWTSIICQALGTIYFQIKGNYEAALATYQAGSVLDENNHEILLALGDVYMSQDEIDKAIKTYCDAINVNPLDYRCYSKAGLALWEKDYLEEAIVAYNKALEINPEYYIASNNLGVIYLDGIGQSEVALQHFKNAVEHNPNYTLAYFNAGRALQAMDKSAEAADYYQMALDLNRVTEELEEDEIKDRLYGLFES